MEAAGARRSRLWRDIAQGGEFSFVIFAAAVGAEIIAQSQCEMLVFVVSLSMVASQFLLMACDVVARRVAAGIDPAYDVVDEKYNAVIIVGFGRVGQIVGRILAARKIPSTALDISTDQIDFVKHFGNKVYYGDASRLDLRRAAGADAAQILVLAIDDVNNSLRTAEVVRQHFPRLRILARACNRKHAYQLMDLDVTHLQRESFLLSIARSHDVLMELEMSHLQAERTVLTFQRYDELRLHEHYTHHDDQKQMQDLARQSMKELEEMFERDAAEQAFKTERERLE